MYMYVYQTKTEHLNIGDKNLLNKVTEICKQFPVW